MQPLLTAHERLQAYRKVRASIANQLAATSPGQKLPISVCLLLENQLLVLYPSFNEQFTVRYQFPEFHAQRPDTYFLYWWTSDREGAHQRINALTRAISLTYKAIKSQHI